MSRCFPFPPPGYEKKSRAEDVDLLKKEKSKEKKHKKEKREKEKREKEKREGKEKRDKDKSDEKRREKKERKKDRDKKKNREKDKDKARTSEERKLLGKTESQNGEEAVKFKENSVQEEKCAGPIDSYIGNKFSQIICLSNETKNSKLVQEVGRRVEACGTAKVDKFSVPQPGRDDGMATMATLVAKTSDPFTDGNEQNKNKKIDRKYNGQGIRHEERFSGNSVVPSPTTFETGVAGMFKSLEKSADRRTETDDKIRQKEGDEKRGDKHKGKDKEKKGRSDDKERRDKEKKKEKKAKEKMEEKNAMVDKSKEINKDNLLGRHSHSTNTNVPQLPDSNKVAAVEENLIKKRKDLEPNGVLHVDNRSSKSLRPTSHPAKENGRILEPCSTSNFPAPERQQGVPIMANKERKINGVIEANSSASAKHMSTGHDDQHAAIPKKSPHPDSKYLSQVYSVPKMEELSDSDTQDWLFSNNTSQAKKPKLEASEAEGTPQVWAEAMQIESADVFALPYVIPY